MPGRQHRFSPPVIAGAMIIIANIIFFGLTLTGIAPTAAQVPPPDAPPTLFSASDQELPLAAVDDPTVARARVVQVDFALLGGDLTIPHVDQVVADQITFNFFDDAQFTAALDYTEPTSTGYAWLGTIVDDPATAPAGSVALIVGANGVRGHVVSVRGSYVITPIGGGLHVLEQRTEPVREPIDDSVAVQLSDAELNAAAPLDAVIAAALSASDESPETPFDTAGRIDLLIVYTDDARADAGGTAAITENIDLAIIAVNQGYFRSNISTRVNLVHTGEVVYDETGDSDIDLERLRAINDGHLDLAHYWRDLYRADVTILLTQTAARKNSEDVLVQIGGLAYVMGSVSTAFASSAFGIVQHDELRFTGFALAHEIGHIQGARHDWVEDNVDNSPYSYNHGFAVRGQFRTIMAYQTWCTIPNPDEPCPVQNNFSNPELTFNGIPMGIPEGSPSAADNRRTLNNTAPTVAFFRDAGPTVSNDLVENAQFFTVPTGGYTQDIHGSTRSGTDKTLVCLNIARDYVNTVWYRYFASSNEPLTISTAGSQYDTILAVLSGNPALTEVACADNQGSGIQQAQLNFTPVNGVTHYIMVGRRGIFSATGSLTLNLNISYAAPTNDLFANADTLSSIETQYVRGATKSGSDPSLSCSNIFTNYQHSVWYRYTAASIVPVVINTVGSGFDTVLGVFTEAEGALTEIGCDDDSGGSGTSQVIFNPVRNGVYYIMAAKFGTGTGAAGSLLRINSGRVTPTNDLFTNAQVANTTISFTYTNVQEMNLASQSASDPALSCYGSNQYSHSVWYRYTPTVSEAFEVNTLGSELNTVVGVFTGSEGNLTEVGCNNDPVEQTSRLFVNLTSGTPYYIMVAHAGATLPLNTYGMKIQIAQRSHSIGCPATAILGANALRDAVGYANATTVDSVINLTPGCTYFFSAVNNSGVDGANALPILQSAVTKGSLTINGNGATLRRTDGAPDFRFFALGSAANVTINDLSLFSGSTDYGGSIMNRDSTLTLNNVAISASRASVNGGANYNNGALWINNSTFTSNSAGNNGGALMTYAGTMVITGSTFTANTATTGTGYGGALITDGGAVTVVNSSTFTSNHAIFGGAVFAFTGRTDITYSELQANTALIHGGALFTHDAAQSIVRNSTLAGNSATLDGGAVFNSGWTHLWGCTVADNQAARTGGGLFRYVGTLRVQETIVAQNSAPTALDVGGAITSLGYNLIGSNSGVTGLAASDLVNPSPGLGPLADNGGPTLTMALLPGSPAINAGDPTQWSRPSTDQRGSGYPRIMEGRVDIGAYEARCPDFPRTVPDGDTVNLIRAVYCANELPTDDVIELAPDATYNMTAALFDGSALPTIFGAVASDQLTINGNGATIQRAEGAPAFSLVRVETGSTLTLNDLTLRYGSGTTGGAIYNTGTLTLNRSTVVDNEASEAGGGVYNTFEASLTVNNSSFTSNRSNGVFFLGGWGGAIYNAGTVTIQGASVFNDNRALWGAALYNDHVLATSASITDTVFLSNTADYEGGAIYSDGTLTIDRSGFSSNTSADEGGALYLDASGSAVVTQSTFAYNSAINGGAVSNRPGSTARLEGSTFSSNTGTVHAGGVLNHGSLTVVNSTFYVNQALQNDGGAIFNSGTATVQNSTFSGNSANLSGGAIFRFGGVVSLANNLIAGNSAPTGPDLGGAFTSLGYNLITSTAGATIGGTTTGNLTGEAAGPLLLSSLDVHGGPTRTIALLPGSVGINQGDPAFAPPPTTDQRGAGFPRVAAGRVDMGAFEYIPGGTLTVQLTLPGLPPAPHARWVTSVHVVITPQAGGTPIVDGDFLSDTYGRFTIPSVMPGGHQIAIKLDDGLEQLYTRDLIDGNNLLTTTSVAVGDANGDDVVNITDFSLLAASFGLNAGQGGFDPRADFNRDGVVNITDFSLLAASFGQAGAGG